MANGDETVREVCADAKNTSTNWIRTMNVLGVMPTRECIHRWCDRILAAHERELAAKDAAHRQWRENYHTQLAAKDAEIAQLVTRRNRFMEEMNTVLELAGCMTNMSIIDAVHYKATHASLKYENGHFAKIEDPVAQQYKLVEEQFIPVFKMLKDAVREAKRIMKEGGEK